MKLKDVLLITNNNKGTEYKYLSSMKDYMTVLFRAFEGSETELAHAVQELCQTKENSQYAEVYLAANKNRQDRAGAEWIIHLAPVFFCKYSKENPKFY